jgi:hypothetical protein
MKAWRAKCLARHTLNKCQLGRFVPRWFVCCGDPACWQQTRCGYCPAVLLILLVYCVFGLLRTALLRVDVLLVVIVIVAVRP